MAVHVFNLRFFLLLNVLSNLSLGKPVKSSCPTGCECMRKGVADCRNKSFSKWPEFDGELMASIEYLDLSGNQIEILPSKYDLREIYPNLKSVALNYNPIRCDLVVFLRQFTEVVKRECGKSSAIAEFFDYFSD